MAAQEGYHARVPRAWLGPLLDKHELRVELPPESPGGVGLIERYGLIRDRVSELWRAERSDILARLATGLRRNAYRADRVRDWAAEIDAYFREDGNPWLSPRASIASRPRGSRQPARVPLRAIVLHARRGSLEQQETLVRSFDARLGALRQALLEEARAALRATARGAAADLRRAPRERI